LKRIICAALTLALVNYDQLPLSENVEDRRGLPLHKPHKTLLQQEREPFTPEPDSPLAHEAGIGDIR
jgi:hypothetical protein